MAKLRAFEIDAVFNKLHNQVLKIREEKLNKIKTTLKLNKEEKELLAIVDEFNTLKEKEKELNTFGLPLARKLLNIKPYQYFDWHNITAEQLIEYRAKQLLPDNLKDTIGDLRNRIVLANIDGNVQELIDNILAEYND